MKKFHIFHAELPSFTEEPEQKRKYAGCVVAESLEQAFVRSQNLDRHWNQKKPCRSTSVGDVIQVDDTDYLVTGTSFVALIEHK